MKPKCLVLLAQKSNESPLWSDLDINEVMRPVLKNVNLMMTAQVFVLHTTPDDAQTNHNGLMVYSKSFNFNGGSNLVKRLFSVQINQSKS